MKTVLVFSTSTGNANTEMMDGVRKFAQGTDWNIQSVKFDGSPFPIRELLKFWSPIGCIVEVSGNGLRQDSVPYRAFGKTPVVYIGGDSLVVPPNAAATNPSPTFATPSARLQATTLSNGVDCSQGPPTCLPILSGRCFCGTGRAIRATRSQPSPWRERKQTSPCRQSRRCRQRRIWTSG